MDLRQLEYVTAVARTLNFTRAANELHIAQPALSRAITKFEQQLGTRLFERTSRRVTVTDAGAAFVSRARRILTDARNLELEMGDYGSGTAGTVRISTWFHLEPVLPRLLRRFTQENRGIDLSIVEYAGSQMLDALRGGEIDVGVAITAPNWDTTDISQIVVRREPLVVILPDTDPFAGRRSVTLKQLAGARSSRPSATRRRANGSSASL